ncbi:MAG: RNA polymerase sigma-54 factor, partial [bacterium]|nr:RNA polymerase sigma-54 factor [bacterium]
MKLAQQLIITPQLQQAIKLLQLTRVELQNLVQQELLENPVLEEMVESQTSKEEKEVSQTTEPTALLHEAKDKLTQEVSSETKDFKEPSDFDWENYIGMYNAAEMFGPTAPRGEAPSNSDLPTYENTVTRSETLQEHLIWQLHLSSLSRDQVEIAEELIGNINDDGYLKSDIQDIAAHNKVDPIAVEAALKKVQEFNPIGVGARDLKECLNIQVNHFEKGENKEILHQIINDHLPHLERKNYQPIVKDLGIPLEKVLALVKIISYLEPKPGRPFGGEPAQYIVPDVFVQKVGEDFVVVLNDDGLPRLQVSSLYRTALLQKTVPEKTRDY